MELERLRNNITTLGQELVDQQQKLDKGVKIELVLEFVYVVLFPNTCRS